MAEKRAQRAKKAPQFFIVGTNHHRASIDVRERLLRQGAADALLGPFFPEGKSPQHLILSTCNRVEAWMLGSDPIPSTLLSEVEAASGIPRETLYMKSGEEASLHAVRVAAGVDSLAWGESQIALQISQALAAARTRGEAGESLICFVRKVLEAARGVRIAAGSDKDSVSAGDAAVACIRERLHSGRPRLLVVGTGKMGRLAAKKAARLAQLTIADRDPEKAARVAEKWGAAPALLEDVLVRLNSFDAAIVAVSAERPVVLADALRTAGSRDPPFIVIDLSVPRCVDPAAANVAGVELYNLDDLSRWAGPPSDPARVERVERQALREAVALNAWLGAQAVKDTVASLRARAEAIRREELEEAWKRLDALDPRSRAVIDKMAQRIVNRILHDPTEAVRAEAGRGGAESAERAVRKLFRLEGAP